MRGELINLFTCQETGSVNVTISSRISWKDEKPSYFSNAYCNDCKLQLAYILRLALSENLAWQMTCGSSLSD